MTSVKETLFCSFCGKSQVEVFMLVKGPNVNICDECVELCVELLYERDKGKCPLESLMVTKGGKEKGAKILKDRKDIIVS